MTLILPASCAIRLKRMRLYILCVRVLSDHTDAVGPMFCSQVLHSCPFICVVVAAEESSVVLLVPNVAASHQE